MSEALVLLLKRGRRETLVRLGDLETPLSATRKDRGFLLHRLEGVFEILDHGMVPQVVGAKIINGVLSRVTKEPRCVEFPGKVGIVQVVVVVFRLGIYVKDACDFLIDFRNTSAVAGERLGLPLLETIVRAGRGRMSLGLLVFFVCCGSSTLGHLFLSLRDYPLSANENKQTLTEKKKKKKA